MEKRRYGTPDNLGMAKHYKSGHPVSAAHFTGHKAAKPIRRKGLTRKQRQAKRGKHVNKYLERK